MFFYAKVNKMNNLIDSIKLSNREPAIFSAELPLAASSKNLTVVAPKKLSIILDSLVDLESLSIITQVLKTSGNTDIQYTSNKMLLNIDIPNFYLFNRKINNLEDLSGLLLIGLNTRFEASLLNTNIRKQQLKRDLFYASIGNYSPLNIQNTHLGVNVKTVLLVLENKLNLVKEFVNTKKSSIFFGAEYLKSKNGVILQSLIRFLGKNFFVKNNNEERLGCIHANISSLSFATLGITAGVRANLNNDLQRDKKINTLFVIQPNNFFSKKFISNSVSTHIFTFATHKPTNLISNRLIPLKSFYEKEGFLYNIEGRLRKFYKVVKAPKDARSLESIFLLLLRKEALNRDWISTLKSLSNFHEEIKLENTLEKYNSSYNINYIQEILNIKDKTKIILMPIFKTTQDFYMTDLITKNSIIMSESSIFFSKKTNIINVR